MSVEQRVSPAVVNRAKGIFFGSAIGDALGAPVEFEPRGSFPPVKDFAPTPEWNLDPGQWTDDTAMAWALADALNESDGYDSAVVRRNYLRWYKDGAYTPHAYCFDIGIQTAHALSVSAEIPLKATTRSGNGVLMRYAPAAIVGLNGTKEAIIKLAKATAIETHNSPEAVFHTQFFALLLDSLLRGQTKDEALSQAWATVKAEKLGVFYHEELDTMLKSATYETIVAGGYSLLSLVAAWYCFAKSESFEEAVLSAVNLGNDADTVGAITGQLAGAYYGYEAIPARWRDNIWLADAMETLPGALLKTSPKVLATRKVA